MSIISRALEKNAKDSKKAAVIPIKPSGEKTPPRKSSDLEAILPPPKKSGSAVDPFYKRKIGPMPVPERRTKKRVPRNTVKSLDMSLFQNGNSNQSWLILALVLVIAAVAFGLFMGQVKGQKAREAKQRELAMAAAAITPTPIPATPTPVEEIKISRTPVTVRVELGLKPEEHAMPLATPELIIPPPPPVAGQAPPSNTGGADPPEIPYEIQPLTGGTLMNEPPSPPAEPPSEPRRSREEKPSGKQSVKEQFQLEGVFWSEKDPMAIINGEIVAEGKQLQGMTVKRIEKTSVVIEVGGTEYTIR